VLLSLVDQIALFCISSIMFGDLTWQRAFLVACFDITILRPAAGQQFDSSVSKCPVRCDFGDQSAWTYYYDLSELEACDGTTIFQLNINNKVDDPNTNTYYRACTAREGRFGH
jgi:hypothetical protein